jgi:hypothetical protein
VEGPVLGLVGGTLHENVVSLAAHPYIPVQLASKLTLGTFYMDLGSVDRHIHALRDGDRLLSNA